MDDSCTPCSEISAEDFFAEAMRRSVRSERSISRHRFHSSLPVFHRWYSHIIEFLSWGFQDQLFLWSIMISDHHFIKLKYTIL